MKMFNFTGLEEISKTEFCRLFELGYSLATKKEEMYCAENTFTIDKKMIKRFKKEVSKIYTQLGIKKPNEIEMYSFTCHDASNFRSIQVHLRNIKGVPTIYPTEKSLAFSLGWATGHAHFDLFLAYQGFYPKEIIADLDKIRFNQAAHIIELSAIIPHSPFDKESVSTSVLEVEWMKTYAIMCEETKGLPAINCAKFFCDSITS